jgi:small subunit ribosomal protein S21
MASVAVDGILSSFILDPFIRNDIIIAFMTIEIKLRKGEPMDRAIRRMKKRLDREGVIRDVRAKRYFEKPSDKKRQARKVAAFTQMLRTRYEKM